MPTRNHRAVTARARGGAVRRWHPEDGRGERRRFEAVSRRRLPEGSGAISGKSGRMKNIPCSSRRTGCGPRRRNLTTPEGSEEHAMNPMESARGRAVVVQPEEGRSWWQPMPANGHAEPKLVPAETGFGTLSMGYQTVAPGSRIRPHSHGDQVELQICFRGRGSVVADGERHPLVPGTACFLGADVKHEIVNESGDEDLVMMWLISAGRPRGLLPRNRPRAHPRRARPASLRPARGRGSHRARGRHERHLRHRPLSAMCPRSPSTIRSRRATRTNPGETDILALAGDFR